MTKKKMDISMSVQVLPCPFCGEHAATLLTPCLVPNNMYQIFCDANRGGCGVSTGRRKSALDVLDLWNTRDGVLICEQEDAVKKLFKSRIRRKANGTNS